MKVILFFTCLANCKTFRIVKVQLYLTLQTPNYCFEVRVPLPALNSWSHIFVNLQDLFV